MAFENQTKNGSFSVWFFKRFGLLKVPFSVVFSDRDSRVWITTLQKTWCRMLIFSWSFFKFVIDYTKRIKNRTTISQAIQLLMVKGYSLVVRDPVLIVWTKSGILFCNDFKICLIPGSFIRKDAFEKISNAKGADRAIREAGNYFSIFYKKNPL